jgi:hypothetical protein
LHIRNLNFLAGIKKLRLNVSVFVTDFYFAGARVFVALLESKALERRHSFTRDLVGILDFSTLRLESIASPEER